MRKIGSILFAAFLVCLASGQLAAQSDDPSEMFLKAYMTAQQGEKLEHENQFKSALAKYRFAGSLLEELRKSHADWQPAIVEYRGRKVSESILRVQSEVSTQDDLTAGPTPLPGGAPVLPQSAAPVESNVEVEVAPSTPRETAARAPSDAAIQETTRKLRDKVDQLEAELQKSRTQISSVEREKESLSGRLKETKSKLDKAQGELDTAKGAERQVRDQLSQAQDSLKKVATAGTSDGKAQQALKGEIAQLKKALASAQVGRAAAEKKRDAANARATEADNQVSGATKERDEALTQVKGMKKSEQHVQVLVAENSDLKQKLAGAEKAIHELGEDKPRKEKELADVKQQLEQLRGQLAASQKQNQGYEITVMNLRSQLDEAGSQLEKVKLTGANAQETAKLTKENEMLRNIIVRERQEEARRDQAKKLMLAEFDKLQIKSDTLTQQIELLAQPVARLTTDELALLRQPVVSISDDNPAAVKASFTFAKQSSAAAAKSTGPGRPEKPSAEEAGSSASGGHNNSTGYTMSSVFKPSGVPNEVVDLARQAKENFDHGKYRSAEKQYQEILTKSPEQPLFALQSWGRLFSHRQTQGR